MGVISGYLQSSNQRARGRMLRLRLKGLWMYGKSPHSVSHDQKNYTPYTCRVLHRKILCKIKTLAWAFKLPLPDLGVWPAMGTFVAGVLSDQSAVEEAYRRLRVIGIQRADISILIPGNGELHPSELDQDWPRGIKIGAVSGIVMGGLVGVLGGTGVLTVPGLGILGTAGLMLSVLAGAGTGGVGGGMIGWLAGLGVGRHDTKQHAADIPTQGILFAVYRCRDWERERVKKILRDCGAQDILPRAG